MKNNKILYITLSIISFTIMAVVLRELRAIFIPLTFAIFLSLIFGRPVKFLSDKKVPTFVTITFVLLTLLIIAYVGSAIVLSSVNSFTKEFPKYERLFTQKLTNFTDYFKIGMDDLERYFENISWNEFITTNSLSSFFKTMVGNFANIMSKTFLTLFFLIFLIAGRNSFIKRLAAMVVDNKKSENESEILVGRVENQLLKYMGNKTLISLITATLGMIFIAIFGVDFVIISGLFLFILNFIPNFGSIIASLFPIFICFFEYGFGVKLVGLSASLLFVQMIMGNLIEPKLLGNQLQLSPIIILISLIFWAWVWGAIGMILAVPITSSIAIIIGEFDSFENISKLMSGE
ncbi:MAG: AI-2E family transporter [Candidatus Cloacimonadota bacterium]|nr:AI-2E family transporter [Candidatus Cloacimonadota bacterium]